MCVCVSVALGYPAGNAHALLLPSAACPALQYFSVLSHTRHDFRGKKKVTRHKVRVLIFPTNMSETFHILRRIKRDAIINAHRSSRKVPFIIAII
jgi:hypothetical protein